MSAVGEQGDHHQGATAAGAKRPPNGHGNQGHPASQVGVPAIASEASNTLRVAMLDSMKFEFSEFLDIHRGDVVRFLVSNTGKIRHGFFIGNAEEQRKHAKIMREMPDMVHEGGNTLSLSPGESGEITWRFQGDPNIVFACNMPGHFEAGMFTNVTLEDVRGHDCRKIFPSYHDRGRATFYHEYLCID